MVLNQAKLDFFYRKLWQTGFFMEDCSTRRAFTMTPSICGSLPTLRCCLSPCFTLSLAPVSMCFMDPLPAAWKSQPSIRTLHFFLSLAVLINTFFFPFFPTFLPVSRKASQPLNWLSSDLNPCRCHIGQITRRITKSFRSEKTSNVTNSNH